MKKIALAVGGLLGLAVAALWLSIDRLVGSAIEEGATRGLGVETSVGFVRLRLLGGELALTGLDIANPEGFDEPHFLTVSSARIAADLRSLRQPVIEIPRIEISGVEVALERDGQRTNFGAILDHVRSSGRSKPEPASPGAQPEKRLVVRLLRIEDVKAHVEWSEVATEETGLELVVPEIELKNLGEQGGGLTTAELSNLIVKSVLGAIARQRGALPGALVSGLDAGLRGAGGVPSMVIRGTGDVLGEAAGGVAGGAVRRLGEDAAGGLDAIGRGAGKALGGLLGRDPEEEHPQ
jgi:hypothetical protein